MRIRCQSDSVELFINELRELQEIKVLGQNQMLRFRVLEIFIFFVIPSWKKGEITSSEIKLFHPDNPNFPNSFFHLFESFFQSKNDFECNQTRADSNKAIDIQNVCISHL